MHSVAEQLVAVSPEIDLVDLSRLAADGSSSGQTLQGGGIFKARAVRADLAPQWRAILGPAPGSEPKRGRISVALREEKPGGKKRTGNVKAGDA